MVAGVALNDDRRLVPACPLARDDPGGDAPAAGDRPSAPDAGDPPAAPATDDRQADRCAPAACDAVAARFFAPPAGGPPAAASARPAAPGSPRAPAAHLDARLWSLGHREARGRLVLGRLAAAFLAAHGHHRLGFARFGDWTRERLGLSAREVQSLAAVHGALAGLPRVAAAFASGRLSWTKVRLLTRVARPEDEELWLARARVQPTPALRALVRRLADPLAPGRDVDPDADDEIDGEPPVRVRLACTRGVRRQWHRALELARRMAGEQGPVWRAAEVIAAEGLSGAPRDAVPCRDVPAPRAAGAVGDPGVEERAAGGSGVGGRAAGDPGAAVPMSGVTVPIASGAAVPVASGAPVPALRPLAAVTAPASPPLPEVARPAPAGARDAAALDARMRRVVATMRALDARIGRALRAAADAGAPRACGFSSLVAYAGDRLGTSAGKVRALLALERRSRRVPAFGAAYARGELSWARALTLLPVVSIETAPAWLARAGAITLRALEGEVEEALDRWDACPERGIPGPRDLDAAAGPAADAAAAARAAEPAAAVSAAAPAPAAATAADRPALAPAAAAARVATGEHQFGARPTLPEGDLAPAACIAPVDAAIAFVAPRSVAVLFHETLAAYAEPREPCWRALERLLGHVIGEWLRQPAHRDPVFSRDGWRCAVPACRGRRNLHDHHLQFRSRGGDNARTNRITVCAWHHLRGIHAGSVRATGRAPDALDWELGLDRAGRPSLRFRGDRYLTEEPTE